MYIDLSSRNLSSYTHSLFDCLLNLFLFFLSRFIYSPNLKTTVTATYEFRHDRNGTAYRQRLGFGHDATS
jgi:hypothetical protein